MKTIALSERTFELLRDLKNSLNQKSFDRLIIELVHTKECSPKSMFGSLKGKTKSFTRAERKKMWEDKEREW